MKALVALSALGALLIPTVSQAAQMCSDRTPREIMSVATSSLKCQKTIAKELGKYAKTKMKELSKCRLKEPTGSCPTAKNTEKMEKAAVKVQEKITKDCGDNSAQAGLTSSSYSNETDDTLISRCALSQYSVDTEVLVGHFTGIATEDPFQDADPKQRAKCVKDLSKLGQKLVLGNMKLISKCLDKAMKDEVGGDLSPRCIGEYVLNVFVPPTDVKTAEKMAKLVTKTEEKIDKSCELTGIGAFDPEKFGFIKTIFACGDAETAADLKDCVVCEGWEGTLDLIEAAYAEDHDTVVSPGGADTLQTAVTAASAGDKIFIRTGTYDETPTAPAADGNGVNIPVGKDDLELIGCGAATNERPFLPAADATYDNGINALSTDDLTFQSLRFEGWDDNAIFVSSAAKVTFRDIVDNGLEETRYAVFPVLSTDILIEACDVQREDDAPIYVGQSDGIEVRFNRVRNGVAGIEFENSINGDAHNNYVANNTGGMLVFKDPNLIDQSGNHDVFSNVFENNNTPNFGSGFVANVPQGTGMLIISNDDSDFFGNIIRGNQTLGVALVDQDAVNILTDPAPDPFPTQSGDEDSFNNHIFRNYIFGNALNPVLAPASDEILAVVNDAGNQENCFELNVVNLPFAEALGTNDCD